MSDASRSPRTSTSTSSASTRTANKGGGAIQDWAAQLGLGEQTGIDLPGRGRRPDPDPGLAQPALPREAHRPPLDARATTSTSRSARATCRPIPLQMAVAYAAIANGGTVVRPHLAERVESVTGEVLEEMRPAPKRQVEISEETRADDHGRASRRAAMEEGGTSYPVFGNFPIPVAGKTGTAERGFTERAPDPRPGLVRGDGAGRRPRDRGRRHARARRLRRRLGRARGGPDPREALPAPDHARSVPCSAGTRR